MKVHEYQAKDVLRRFGVAVPHGGSATTPAEAVEVARTLPGPVWVVKAQVHAGGRGKGRFRGEVSEDVLDRVLKGEDGVPGRGGVRLARSLEEVGGHAEAMLGRTLVTKQTGGSGVRVRRVYVEQGCAIARELYLAALLDRSRSQVVVMASTEGGTEIEEVAAHHPERIHKVWVDPAVGFAAFQARQLGFALGLAGGSLASFQRLVTGLVAAYHGTDASLAEVNPLVITEAGDAIALDAKMTFDDNGLFRHPEIAALRDLLEEDPNEVEASKHDLNYIKLSGDIGCMVNGAGLAMATMDIIKLNGGEPANFLDVGGGATLERVAAGFRIITSDPAVRGILVNIFGGIMKCDVIAEGVLAAVAEVGLSVPLVVRLEGTNVERGRALIAESGLPVITADSMEDAAHKVVAAARAGRSAWPS
ncbi:MAG: ADP-forming succinate--CoA ligase subunit beta [Deltaproteobacteria bacterium]|nr:ADP-forming succinate--CoA ligase subunit beta [Deltaproteobacteria bacterium]